MPLRISCPEGHTLVVSQARAGQAVRCPKCNARIVVPPPAPRRAEALVDLALAALENEPETSVASPVVVVEREPPLVVTPPEDVTPPPVWSPPPKSRAIVEEPPAPEPVEEKLAEQKEEPAVLQVVEPAAPPTPLVEGERPPETGQELNSAQDLPMGAEDDPHSNSESVASAASAHRSEPKESPTEPPAAATDQSPSLPAEDARPVPLVPNASQQFWAYALSISLGAAALFGIGPAVWDVYQYSQAAEGAFIARWALMLVVLGVVQGAYAVYLSQLPDWTSGWVVTLVSLALAAMYAGMLGVTLLAGDESFLIRGLDLADVLGSGRAAMWCLCMTSIMASLAFFAGRMSLRWGKAEA